MPQKNLMMKKKILIIGAVVVALAIITTIVIFALPKKKETKLDIEFLSVNSQWADSLIETMTLEEKVGQLIFLSNAENVSNEFIKKYNIGGANITEKTINEQIGRINDLQAGKIPLFIGSQTENLTANFLLDIIQYPSLKAIFSVKNDTIQKQFSDMVILQDSLLGVNINFLNLTNYIADTNLTDTAFIEFYSKKINSFTKKLQSNKILSCVEVLDLPNDSTSLKPKKKMYEKLRNNGLASLFYTEKSDEKLGFKGIMFKKYSKDEDIDLFFEQNFDVLVIENNYEGLVNKLIKEASSERKYEKILDDKVKKVLLAKTWLNLTKKPQLNHDTSKLYLNTLDKLLLSRELYQKSISILKNDEKYLPIKDIEPDFVAFSIGEKEFETFTQSLNHYKAIENYHINPLVNKIPNRMKIADKKNILLTINNYELDDEQVAEIQKVSENQKLVIVNFRNTQNLKKLQDFPYLIHVWDTTSLEQDFSAQLIFGGIEAKAKLPINISEKLHFQTGFFTPKIRLKYTIPEEVGLDSKKLAEIDSIVEDGIRRGATPGCQIFVAKNGCVVHNKGYGYHTYARRNKVKTNDLYDIASVTKIAAATLASMKMVEQGKLSLSKEIGEYYENTKIEYTRIKPDTILNIDTLNINEVKDINKILKNQDTLHINDSIIVAYDTLIVTATPKLNIFKVTAKDLLRHESGLLPAMPILPYLLWRQEYNKYVEHFEKQKDSTQNDSIEPPKMLSRDEFKNRIYSTKFVKDSSEVEIASSMYLNKRYQDTLWIDTKQLRAYSRKIYQYSDVNMILLQQTIDTINKSGIDEYMDDEFYSPLGLQTTCYKPLKNFGKDKIVPTEMDNFWRQQLVHGHVHDPSAALIGGISGNAGLFSSAHDLGVLFQMVLNGGTYGGKKYLTTATIDLYTRTQPDSYRGLGFDKWSKKQIIAKDASPNTYGHTGFTGCCLWNDPDNEIVFVFLSNRVHPSAKNWKLNSYKIRNKTHQAVYDAMIK